MKRILIILMALSVMLLCGCSEEEERKTANNEAMDKKVEQMKSGDKEDASPEEEIKEEGNEDAGEENVKTEIGEETGKENVKVEIGDGVSKENAEMEVDESISKEDVSGIEKAVKKYVDCMMKGDAYKYAQLFPTEYIEAIMKNEGCNRDVAVGIASTRIWKFFSKIEGRYTDVKAASKDGYYVKVTKINRFRNETALINEYSADKIKVTDVVEAAYEIEAKDNIAEGYIRFVKTAKSGWEVDVSYFNE